VTVAELIARLTRLVENEPSFGALPVLADGCDCEGEARAVRVKGDARARYVLIARDGIDVDQAPPRTPMTLAEVKHS
jgi:hypothetical protein